MYAYFSDLIFLTIPLRRLQLGRVSDHWAIILEARGGEAERCADADKAIREAEMSRILGKNG